MAFQDIIKDVKTRVETARKPYSEAFQAYVDTQKKAFGVVTGGAQTLAKTEADAAKDVFEAARSSFDKARSDGLKQIASQPQAYVLDSRERIVAAYKETVDQLRKTGTELGDVVSKGYQSVVNKLTGQQAAKKGAKPAAKSTAKKASASKSGSTAKNAAASKATTSKATAGKTTAARKTASSRSSTSSKAKASTESASS